MTDVARTRERSSNQLQLVIDNSKPALLFLAFILPNDSSRTMIVNRRTLARIPNERNNGKGVIGRPIEKVLCIRLGWNCATVLFIQPIALRHKTSEQRLDSKNRILRFLNKTNRRLNGVDKIPQWVPHSVLMLMNYRAPSHPETSQRNLRLLPRSRPALTKLREIDA